LNLMSLINFTSIQREYIKKIIPLKIWHVRYLYLKDKEKYPIAYSFDLYVDVYRKTCLFDGKESPTTLSADFQSDEWDNLKSKLEFIIIARQSERDSYNTEQECLEFLWPYLEAKLNKNFVPLRKDEKHPYGCWRYNIRDDNEKVILIHIANAYQPDSPFDKIHFPLFVSDLLEMLHHARAAYPQATILRCGTWMNHIPKFVSLFPNLWADNLKDIVPLGTGGGFWGQYVDRTGRMHEKNAATFRETGAHAYFPYAGFCPLDEGIRHLEILKNKLL